MLKKWAFDPAEEESAIPKTPVTCSSNINATIPGPRFRFLAHSLRLYPVRQCGVVQTLLDRLLVNKYTLNSSNVVSKLVEYFIGPSTDTVIKCTEFFPPHRDFYQSNYQRVESTGRGRGWGWMEMVVNDPCD